MEGSSFDLIELLTQHSSEGTEENYEKLQDSYCLGRDSNPASLEDMTGALPLYRPSRPRVLLKCIINKVRVCGLNSATHDKLQLTPWIKPILTRSIILIRGRKERIVVTQLLTDCLLTSNRTSLCLDPPEH
jgi:hypothetical protein